jgi:hypothetical protein
MEAGGNRLAISLLGVALAASVMAACSGGSQRAFPAPTPTPAASVTTVPTTVPTTDPSGRPTTAPTTVPTTIPTNTPNSTLKVTPASLSLTLTGSTNQGTLTATETGVAGSPSVSGCTSVATATVGTTTAGTTPIVVAATAAGTCTLVVADASGQRVTIPVAVASGPTPSPTTTPTVSPSASPTALPSGLFPMTISNNTGINGAMTAYVWGIDPTSGNYVYLTSPSSGVTAPVTTGSVAGFPLASGGEIDLPKLCSGRVYVALDGKSLTLASTAGSPGGVTVPVPWQNPDADNSANVIFDFVEYTWADATAAKCQQPQFFIDTTQVDSIGIPISFQLAQPGQLPTTPIGMMPNAVTKIGAELQMLGSPWTGLSQSVQSTTTTVQRIINPSHPTDPSATPATGLSFDTNYFNNTVYALWSTYQSTDLVLSGAFVAPNYQTVYGRVTGLTSNGIGTVFTFWSGPNQTGSVVATLPSPVPTGVSGLPTTNAVLSVAGILAPSLGPGVPAGTSTYVGRIIGVGLNRATFTTNAAPAQPLCPTPGTPPNSPAANAVAAMFYGGTATAGGSIPTASVITNWYSALVHANAYQGLAYGFSDDDECNAYSSSFTAPNAGYTAGEKWQVTLNPL